MSFCDRCGHLAPDDCTCVNQRLIACRCRSCTAPKRPVPPPAPSSPYWQLISSVIVEVARTAA